MDACAIVPGRGGESDVSRNLTARTAWTLAAILAVAAPALAQSPPTKAGPPAAPVLERHKTKHFDIFAPTKDFAASREEMVEAAAERFIALMGKTPPRGALVLADPAHKDAQWARYMSYRKHGAKWVMPWTSRHPMGEGLWPPYGETNSIGGGDPLPHEAAHLMLVFAVNDGCSAGLKQRFNGYGSYLPDWVDEGVAIYVEHEAIRSAQRRLMARNMEKRIPFEEFFAMDHPGAPKIGGKPNPAAGHGFAGGMGRAQIYYMETVTVVEFLEAAAGAEGFRKILRTLQTGATMDKALKHLPEWYPRDLAGLEEVWMRWVEDGELPERPEPEPAAEGAAPGNGSAGSAAREGR